jgi:uncharacterized protein (TIGR02757 family)
LEILNLLNQQLDYFYQPAFIENDPISIPHLFSQKEDIEIAGFITALISWGRRPAILKTARNMLEQMDFQPYAFVMNSRTNDLKKFEHFVYRTFNSSDLLFIFEALRQIYATKGGLEGVCTKHFQQSGNIRETISGLRTQLLQYPHLSRSEKHLANPMKGSAAKRINMFLRWMVRNDPKGVDFGIWKGIPSSALMIPLDVHSGNTARKLDLLTRRQNDWKAVEELTIKLRQFDPEDPVKYDYALFGMGVKGVL